MTFQGQKIWSEITQDKNLRIFGSLLAIVSFLNFLLWWQFGTAHFITLGKEAICWPFLTTCSSLHIFSQSTIELIFLFLGFASLVSGYLIYSEKFSKHGLWILLILMILKFGIILTDYRFRLNQNIMLFWILIAFFFLPQKKTTIKIFVVLFYFWAGLLKINMEWLSGSSLYIKPWPLEGIFLSIACTFVVILETMFIWGLLSKKAHYRYFTLILLLIFHLFSFQVVGYYYPIMMMVFLSIFILDPHHFFDFPVFFKNERRNYFPLIILLVFNLLQIYPKFFPGDTSLTGEGRVFSLHMFDSLTSCEVEAIIHRKDGSYEKVDAKQNLRLAPRIHCDPIVYLSRARNICFDEKPFAYFKDMDIVLRSKRTTDSSYKLIFNLENFCSKPASYSLFGHQAWILSH